MIKKKYTKKQIREAHRIVRASIKKRMDEVRTVMEEIDLCPCDEKTRTMMCHVEDKMYQCLECGDIFNRIENGTINFTKLDLSDEEKEGIIDRINNQRKDEK